jgi:hypothetical protein
MFLKCLEARPVFVLNSGSSGLPLSDWKEWWGAGCCAGKAREWGGEKESGNKGRGRR